MHSKCMPVEHVSHFYFYERPIQAHAQGTAIPIVSYMEISARDALLPPKTNGSQGYLTKTHTSFF